MDPTLITLAQKHGVDVAQIVVRKVTKHGVSVLPASTNVNRQHRNLVDSFRYHQEEEEQEKEMAWNEVKEKLEEMTWKEVEEEMEEEAWKEKKDKLEEEDLEEEELEEEVSEEMISHCLKNNFELFLF